MAARKKQPTKKAKSRPAPKKAAKKVPKKVARKPAKATKRAPTRPKAAAKAKTPKNPLAERMAAFSEKVLEEEEAPVAVRTFNEARAGVDASKTLDVKSGSVEPIEEDDEPEDDEDELVEFEEVPPPPLQRAPLGAQRSMSPPTQKPAMQPLSGPAAVPKTKPTEEFKVAPPPGKKKKDQLQTRDDLGKIELKMQRGTKDATIANASPDYLQRSYKKAAQSGKTSATSMKHDESNKSDAHFEVAQDKPDKPLDSSLLDFGDVEIAQQTRKGKKTLGKLDTDEEDAA